MDSINITQPIVKAKKGGFNVVTVVIENQNGYHPYFKYEENLLHWNERIQ